MPVGDCSTGMRYTDIPVYIGSHRLLVTYDYTETIEVGKTCTITADGKRMTVAEDLSIISSTMPHEWQQPIISKLKELIAGQGY